MSRSGYCDDADNNWDLIRWRGAVKSAIRGKRGQKLLRELLDALDGIPTKRLIANELEVCGEFCALGAVGHTRGLQLNDIDAYESEQVARAFDISDALAREVMFKNDEGGPVGETPEQRWSRVRAWVADQIIPPNAQDEPQP